MSPGGTVGLKPWKFNMKMCLLQQEVWSCIEERKSDEVKEEKSKASSDLAEDTRKEQLAFTFIMLSLSESVQAVVRRCTTAKETWDALEIKYGGKDVEDRMELRQRLRDAKLKKGDKMLNHLARIQDNVEQLVAAGGELPEEEVVLTTLNSLPSTYDVVKVMLRTRGKAVTMDELQSILLAEERRCGQRESPMEAEEIYTLSQANRFKD